jgi:hypothetical protein
MNNIHKSLLLTLILVLTPFLMADMGPKPTAEFEIIYQINPIPELVDFALYQCDTPDCAAPSLLEELGPQGIDCTQDSCSSMAYSYREYLYITLDFADGTSRTSNTFTKEHFNAEYSITVLENSLSVIETGGSGKALSGLGAMIIFMYAFYICLGLVVLATTILITILIIRYFRKRTRTSQPSRPPT